MTELMEALMHNEGCSRLEAQEIIEEMKESLHNGCTAEEVFGEYGLESDYVMDLLFEER